MLPAMIIRGMSVLLRLLLPVALLWLALVPASGAALPARASSVRFDIAITGKASVMRAHDGVRQVRLWLDRQPSVSGSSVGRDGTTISIYFHDGLHTAVLWPRMPSYSGIRRGVLAPSMNRLHRMLQTGRRAIVLEPFRTELQLGPDAGASETSALQAAGYNVDTFSNAGVTVDVMKTLGAYNVVYDDTHSGVNEYGEGVVATGQVYNANPDLEPYMHEFSVMPVAVAGSPLLFYGVLSRFVQSHIDAFPPESIVFWNGCDMLRASRVWTALQQKGVVAMVSWDGEVLPSDAVNSAGTFFGALSSGADVVHALTAVRSAGQGTSQVDGQAVARLDFVGEGRATLSGLLSPEQPTPPMIASPTALPPTFTPTPTTTPLPVSTATPMPVANVPLPNPTVRIYREPGKTRIRVVLIRSAPNALVTLRVRYAGGFIVRATVRADSSGAATYRFRQRPNAVSPVSRTMQVDVRVTANGRVAAATVTSRADYAPLDLFLSLRSPGMLWVRGDRNGRLTVKESPAARGGHVQQVRLPARRWISLTLRTRVSAPLWRPGECVIGTLRHRPTTATSRLCMSSFSRST